MLEGLFSPQLQPVLSSRLALTLINLDSSPAVCLCDADALESAIWEQEGDVCLGCWSEE